jgi:ketosteroid isomerase-like protein
LRHSPSVTTRRVTRSLLAGALLAGSATADSDVDEISAREAAFSAAVAQENLEVVESLVTNDVRIVRSDGITFTTVAVKRRLAPLFGLAPELRFSRSVETVQVSESRELAVVTGSQSVTDSGGRSSGQRYLAIWRRMPEFEEEWRLAFDAPLEVWESLDGALSVDAVAHTPGRFVVHLAPSDLAQEMEPASFRPSKAQDLAYSVGEYFVPPTSDAPETSLIWGTYLAVWEMGGSGWRLLHASFPEPKRTSPQ